MRKCIHMITGLLFVFLLLSGIMYFGSAQESNGPTDLDQRVKQFLERHENQWRHWNVPVSDGKFLHNLIIKHDYKQALEIGTSTGHSAIWMAWALSKTGGKLTTIEINEDRYKKALENFEAAGVSEYIDARLADAHQLVKELEGPFDFVFCDADKAWYKNYFTELEHKIVEGGCYTAHNVRSHNQAYGGKNPVQQFLDYAMQAPNYETTIVESGFAGISVSYKKSKQKQ